MSFGIPMTFFCVLSSVHKLHTKAQKKFFSLPYHFRHHQITLDNPLENGQCQKAPPVVESWSSCECTWSCCEIFCPKLGGSEAETSVIERFREKYPVDSMCRMFEVSRSDYYAWRKRQGKPARDQQLVDLIVD